MSRITTYEHLYVLQDPETKKFVLTYMASSQKHKALFQTRKKAEEANNWYNNYYNIVEL